MVVDATALERLLKQDRAITALGLVAIASLCWYYTILVASMGGGMAGAGSHMAMPHDQPWGGVDFLLMFAMWMAVASSARQKLLS